MVANNYVIVGISTAHSIRTLKGHAEKVLNVPNVFPPLETL